MRAIQVEEYGGPEVLKVAEVADPVAGPGQVVVEVAAADVLFLDCQVRGGWGEMFGVVPPYVPGNGVAGVVVSLGDGADRRWLGSQVVAVTAAAGPQGGYAERAVVSGHVVAAARGERKLVLLRSLGAEAVDYSAPEWTQVVRRETGGTGPDVILDGVGGQIGRDAFSIIATGGRFSAHGVFLNGGGQLELRHPGLAPHPPELGGNG
jgi:NADPH2:quinone reductase